MADPYEVLELPRDCGDTEIRRRYLDLVRRHPPDREPEQFAAIRKAYDQLRDPVVRMESRLFDLEPDETLDAILAEVVLNGPPGSNGNKVNKLPRLARLRITLSLVSSLCMFRR